MFKFRENIIVGIIVKHFRKAIIIAFILQIVAYTGLGLKSFTLITPIIFLLGIWLLIEFLIRIFVKTQAKIVNYTLLNSTIVFTAIILEFFLRLSGAVEVYSEKRSFCYQSIYDNCANYYINGNDRIKSLKSPQEFSYTRVPNNEGYSDNNWTITKPDSIIRVLVMGDSFTEGDGAHKDSTWIKFLERKLNNNRLNFMNAGLSGSDPIFYYYNLEKKLLKYLPDFVIICINQSDIDDIIVRGGTERFTANGIKLKKTPWWEPIYAASHISRLFFRCFFDKNLILKSESEIRIDESIKTIESTLLKFKTICKTNNCIFVCITHPTNCELETKCNCLKDIIQFCRSNGIICIDLYDYYVNNGVSNNINFYYWEKDGHHNANGYKIMADGIYFGLIKSNIYLQN